MVTSFLDSNYPDLHRVLRHPEHLFIKYIEEKPFIKFGFSGHLWTGLSIDQSKKKLGCLIQIYISVMNFNAKSAEEPTIYDLLFIIVINSSNKDNKHPFEIRN